MVLDQLHDRARQQALGLPGAELTFPFGPETDVFKVQGKVFLLLGSRHGVQLVTAKARPADAKILCTAYEDIDPGYHMNKKHWISIREGDVPSAILTDIVTESYLLVVESLPLRLRPVNTDTFGQIAPA